MPDLNSWTHLDRDFDLVPDPDNGLVLHLVRKDGVPVGEAEIRKQQLRLESLVAAQDGLHSLRAAAASTGIRVCAEGDSWVNILWPLSAAKGYDMTFVDAMGEDRRFQISNIGWPGDEFDDIVRNRQYEQLIKSNSFDFFVLSGGGNDFLGGGSLEFYLKRFDAGVTRPEDHIDLAKLDERLAKVSAGYDRIVREVNAWSTRTRTLIHSYAYAIPRPGSIWLGLPFAKMGYDPTDKLCAEIIHFVVDRFFDTLAAVASRHSRVTLIDVRRLCEGNWHDELHPNTAASHKIAAKFIEHCVALTPSA